MWDVPGSRNMQSSLFHHWRGWEVWLVGKLGKRTDVDLRSGSSFSTFRALAKGPVVLILIKKLFLEGNKFCSPHRILLSFQNGQLWSSSTFSFLAFGPHTWLCSYDLLLALHSGFSCLVMLGDHTRCPGWKLAQLRGSQVSALLTSPCSLPLSLLF